MDIRYYVEHVVLPSLLEQSPKDFVNALGQRREELLVDIYAQAAENMKQENPYKKEDFHVDLVKYQEEWFFQIIKMPEKDIKSPFCHFVIVSLDKNQDNARLFMLEHQDGAILICEWNKTRHYAYGKFQKDDDILKRIIDIRLSTRA